MTERSDLPVIGRSHAERVRLRWLEIKLSAAANGLRAEGLEVEGNQAEAIANRVHDLLDTDEKRSS